MGEFLLIGLASIIVLGVSAQWLAWRLRLPSILLLLAVGFLAGPVTGLLNPDELLGELIFPLVSISVAVILFEGGLTLRFAELPKVGSVIFLLISVGAAITWGVAALGAHYVLGLDWALSVLLGAVLVVTGPTVIGPLLRQIRPTGQTGAILKWEGILIDPVGAVLAVLIFEAILAGEFNQAPGMVALGVLQTLLIGLGLGFVGAGAMILLLRRYWIPDHLQNGVALLMALTMFALSNVLHPEAGLLTVTVMGLILANQKWVTIRQIVEFKENLRVLLIGSLFILLSARLELGSILDLGWRGLIFLGILVLVARPLAVLASTWRSDLSGKERAFLAWMAPRGIVAASVASIFAFELVEAGHRGAESLVSVTFLVIVGTVALYGLTAGPLARRLGLAEADPQGVLFIGADVIARTIAMAIQDNGFRTALIDANADNARAGEEVGLTVYYGNALSEEMLERLDLGGIGRLIALTRSKNLNSLAALHFLEVFDRSEVYQLPRGEEKTDREPAQRFLGGRFLFRSDLTYREMQKILAGGGGVETITLTEDMDYQAYQSQHGNQAIPLFLVSGRQKLIIYTTESQPTPKPGQTLISLVPPGAVAEPVAEAANPAQGEPAAVAPTEA